MRALRATPICALLVLAAFGWGRGPSPVAAEDPPAPEGPREVPVRVAAEVDAREAGEMALWRVKLAYQAEDAPGRPYRVVLHLVYQGQTLLDLGHTPRPPVSGWKKGQKVAYELPVPLPTERGLRAGAELELRLGFLDPETERVLPCLSEETPRAGLITVARLVVPEMAPTDPEDVLARILARGEELTKAGHRADAWRLLETALRRAAKDATKLRLRDSLLKLGSLVADPPSPLEEGIVAARIAAERVRWLREQSGRCYDRGQLHAALRLLEELGGALEEQSGAAVIGALADAKRAQKDLDDLRVRILGKATDEEKAEGQALLGRLHGAALLKEARQRLGAGQYAVARILVRSLVTGSDHALAGEARALQQELERAWLADTPPEEAAAVDAARNHPAFGRLATVASHKFLYLGPKGLVEGIPAESRLRYDLAFVLLTDLFGVSPNPGGDRITVYYKELWDFGGGQGGGKTIDIGRADPEAKGTRVDTGLLYHELTHCVDDTDPIYSGFREGLANFGAAYLFEMLGQEGDQAHAFASNLEAFRRDYLGRDLAYWRIQDYGPSAGFFLHFADKYTRVPGGHDWAPYRKFFRAYRRAPSGDGREPYIARALAHYLVESFGPGAFDDLLAFRFPLVPSDRDAVRLEAEAWAKGEEEVARRVEELARHPNSPAARDMMARHMLKQRRDGPDAVRAAGRELGVIYDWQVIGPFRSPGADPRARVFPPEEEIDLAKQYDDGLNSCRWRKAAADGVVTVDPYGWVALNFSYMDDTASYALSWVTVERETPAFVHVRADDDVALFLNDRRVEGYVRRGETGWQHWFRGPQAPIPDAMRLPITLAAGRNKVLLKLKNRQGPAGFVLALSQRDGQAIPGLKSEAESSGPSTVTAPPTPTWKDVTDQTFRSKQGASGYDVVVGRFKVVNKQLVGEATDQKVAWRRYSVRPGYPTDGPSNLLWFKEKVTEGLSDFRLRIDLLAPPGQAPKIAVVFQGDGGADGLAGWTLIVHPDGDKKVGARLERYEDLHYQLPAQDLPPPGKEEAAVPLLLTVHDGRLTATLGTLTLFKNVSLLPIPGKHRIGFSTWGPSTGIEALELERPAPPR
jgi:hypothetical protein